MVACTRLSGFHFWTQHCVVKAPEQLQYIKAGTISVKCKDRGGYVEPAFCFQRAERRNQPATCVVLSCLSMQYAVSMHVSNVLQKMSAQLRDQHGVGESEQRAHLQAR